MRPKFVYDLSHHAERWEGIEASVAQARGSGTGEEQRKTMIPGCCKEIQDWFPPPPSFHRSKQTGGSRVYSVGRTCFWQLSSSARTFNFPWMKHVRILVQFWSTQRRSLLLLRTRRKESARPPLLFDIRQGNSVVWVDCHSCEYLQCKELKC